MNKSATEIAVVCDQIKDLLISKNMRYGDSALDPCRVFSKANGIEQLLVRIDDKLSRIQRGSGLIANDEDVVNDLIGYLVLLKVALARQPKRSIYQEVLTDARYFPEYYGSDRDSDIWDGTDIEPKPTVRNHHLDAMPVGVTGKVPVLGDRAPA